VVGTADRFQDVAYQTQPLPPFTAFLIRGPVKLNVSMWWGGWDKYVDVTEDNAAFMVAKLQEKVDTIYRDHPDDYAIRGVRACRIIGPNERQSCDVIVPARR